MALTVVMATDFSDAAETALAWAARLTRLAGGKLHLIHVVPTLTVSPTRADDDAVLIRELRDAAVRHEAPAEVAVVRAVEIAPTVIRFASELNADIIVVGTAGRSGIRRAVLGSVADNLVRNAPCPVLTVREGSTGPLHRREKSQ